MTTKCIFGFPAMILVFYGGVFAQMSRVSSQGNQETPAAAQTSQAVNAQAFDFSGAQNPFLGGIPTGEPTPGVIPLSFSEALKRALSYNLGTVLGEQSLQATRGVRMLALSQLLPKVTTGVSDVQQQVNLEAFGFRPSPGVPTVVGPFNVFDVRAYVSQTILDFSALNRYRAETENVKAAEFNVVNSRDLVVFVCSNLYLQAVASQSRIEATRAQVNTAKSLYNLALDQKAAGVSPGIEVLRAQVELQAQQQRLIVEEDRFAKDKLALARAIGLPLGQEFSLSDGMSYVPFPEMPLDETVQRAYRDRPDYQSAQARVRAAQSSRKAAQAGRLPTLNFGADYGAIGQRPWESHGTFTVATSFRFPIFQGGSVRARVLEADAVLRQRGAELEDLRGRIYYEVRSAFLDLQAAADSVQVAEIANRLAKEQVEQSQDRFRAGVTNNVEVVQAQEALARASESYISSLQAHNAAKLALAKAIGISDAEYIQFLRGK
jgi:outer membrane protein TolC